MNLFNIKPSKKIKLSIILSLELVQIFVQHPLQNLFSPFNKQNLDNISKKIDEIHETEIKKNNILKPNVFETKKQKELINELNKKTIYLIVGENKLSFWENFVLFLKKQKPIQEQLLLIKTRSQSVNKFAMRCQRWIEILFFTQDEKGYFKGQKNRILLGEGTGNRSLITKFLLRPFYRHYIEETKETVKFHREVQQASEFHSNNFYYPDNNQGGFKSICPVFFDFETVEDFMLEAMETDLEILSDITAEGEFYDRYLILNDKWKANILLNPILRSKIIEIGLGDFIRYYSQFDLKNSENLNKEDNPLKKIEFLFIPKTEQLIRLGKKNKPRRILKKIFWFLPNNLIKLEQPLSFNDYIKKYFSLKKEN
jgi:hypothetical protein